MFFSIKSYSQGEANNWYFGNYAGVNFNGVVPIPLTNGQMSKQEGCASISDASGNLLFYTNGQLVFNSNHVLMPNGIGLNGDISATGGSNYNWYPTAGLSCTACPNPIATPTVFTVYCVEVNNSGGCKDTACVKVKIELLFPSNENLQIPNAFSPNNDETNDNFCLQGWDVFIENFSIIICNRCGEKVYESIDPNFCWDGVYKNQLMNSQVFVYYIDANFSNQKEKVKRKGNISLFR